MTQADCQPLSTLVLPSEREDRPDRLADLLECLADLVVETHRCRGLLEQLPGGSDVRVQTSITDLERLEHKLRAVGMEAASVHQRLVHERLI